VKDNKTTIKTSKNAGIRACYKQQYMKHAVNYIKQVNILRGVACNVQAKLEIGPKSAILKLCQNKVYHMPDRTTYLIFLEN
jgi:hypothetical protein